MKVFIFGAGASKGSQDKIHPVAPLVDELFLDKFTEFASQIGLHEADIVRYKSEIEVSGLSLEDWLTTKWEGIEKLKTNHAKASQWREFAHLTYYVWWLMARVSSTYQGYNGYRQLAQKIVSEDEPFGMINFNYDTLLDQALQDVMNFDLGSSLTQYFDNNYIKPHGSVNWFLMRRTSDSTINANSPIAQDLEAQLDLACKNLFDPEPIPLNLEIIPPSHKIGSPNFIAGQHFGYKYVYPMILIPLSTKLYAKVAEFNERVITASKKLIAEADKIYFIGYSANDKIIDEFLAQAKTDTKVFVVGKGSAEETMTKILGKNKALVRGEINDNGFISFIDNYQHFQ